MALLPEIRKIARAGAFVALTGTAITTCRAHIALRPRSERDAIYGKHLHRFIRGVYSLFRVKVKVLRADPPKTAKARLVIANHRSALDIAVLLDLFEAKIVSRSDLADWPVLGSAAKLGGSIFVDREEGGSRATALRAMRTQLEAGYTVGVFAEGGTFEGDEVRPLHPGAFLAARGLSVDVLPVGLAYTKGTEFLGESFVAHLGNIARRDASSVVVSIGKPIPIRNGARDLANEVRAAIQALVDEARGELDRIR